eukprot:scaffold8365_cov267-Pinguiococcus_pyrenoidosus.AAC.4
MVEHAEIMRRFPCHRVDVDVRARVLQDASDIHGVCLGRAQLLKVRCDEVFGHFAGLKVGAPLLCLRWRTEHLHGMRVQEVPQLIFRGFEGGTVQVVALLDGALRGVEVGQRGEAGEPVVIRLPGTFGHPVEPGARLLELENRRFLHAWRLGIQLSQHGSRVGHDAVRLHEDLSRELHALPLPEAAVPAPEVGEMPPVGLCRRELLQRKRPAFPCCLHV